MCPLQGESQSETLPWGGAGLRVGLSFPRQAVTLEPRRFIGDLRPRPLHLRGDGVGGSGAPPLPSVLTGSVMLWNILLFASSLKPLSHVGVRRG